MVKLFKSFHGIFAFIFIVISLLLSLSGITAQQNVRTYESVLFSGYRLDIPADWWLTVQTQRPWEGLIIGNTLTALESQLEDNRAAPGDIIITTRVADEEIVDAIAARQSVEMNDLIEPLTQAMLAQARVPASSIEEITVSGRRVLEASITHNNIPFFIVLSEWEHGFAYALALKSGSRFTAAEQEVVRNIITSVRPQNSELEQVPYLSDYHSFYFERPRTFDAISESSSFIEIGSETMSARILWLTGESMDRTLESLAQSGGINPRSFERRMLDNREFAYAFGDATGSGDNLETIIAVVQLYPTAYGVILLTAENPRSQLDMTLGILNSMQISGRRVREVSLTLTETYNATIADYTFDYPNRTEWSISNESDNDLRSMLPTAIMEFAFPMLFVTYSPTHSSESGSMVLFIPPLQSDLGSVMALSTDLLLSMMLDSAPTVEATETYEVLVSGRRIQVREIDGINNNSMTMLTFILSDNRVANIIVQDIDLDVALAIAASLRVQGEVSPYQPDSTPGPSPTPTNTFTPTATFTPSNTPTATDTPTVTPTASNTPTPSDTPTATFTPTNTATVTLTPTATITPTLVQCASAPSSRLYPGDRGRVTDIQGHRNRVRSQPTINSETLGYLEALQEFDVLEGPICADGYAWYRVQNEGLIGWTAEGTSDEYWLEQIERQASENTQPEICVVIANNPTNIRSGPGTNFRTVGRLSAGQRVEVSGFQEDTTGSLWWRLVVDAWVLSDVVATEGDCAAIINAGSSTSETEALHIGGLARVYVEDEGLSLRRGTGTNFSLIERLPAGTEVEILDGPVSANGYVWWQVRAPSGREGWVVEGADGIITLIPVP